MIALSTTTEAVMHGALSQSASPYIHVHVVLVSSIIPVAQQYGY